MTTSITAWLRIAVLALHLFQAAEDPNLLTVTTVLLDAAALAEERKRDTEPTQDDR